MTTAFQVNAFQDDAFQIDAGPPQTVSARGSGRLVRGWWRKRSGLYWPKKISKKVVKEAIEEAMEELPPDMRANYSIDSGVLAERLTNYGPGFIRALQAQEAFIAAVVRELQEQDDEEVIMWLLND